MFMDNLSSKTLNIILIISIIIATLGLILVIVLPNVLKTKKTNDFTQKSSPTLENTNLWAKFPGELISNLTHNYGFFNYKKNEEDKYEIEIISNISIKEEISYSNFSENKEENTIYVKANRSYEYIEENDDEKNPVNSINMGLFEALETISYPTLYKVGINSINYLINRTLIEPDLFIRELFTYKIFNEIDETFIRQEILNKIPEDKIEKILSNEDKYINYSFKNIKGFFNWIKSMGLKEKISRANWLSELFELTDNEINSILQDENAYLIVQYKEYNSELIRDFNCENKTQCGVDLLYAQLINGSVISTLQPEVKDYLSLNNILGLNYYPFNKTPEMIFYFDEEYKNKLIKEESQFIDYSPTKDQLDSLLNINSENCLLSPNNSIYLLHLNNTEDKMKQKIYYLNLTLKQINFLSYYLYDFLPKIFLYPEIEKERYNKNNGDIVDEPLFVEPIAKTVSTMIQDIADKTYKLMKKINLYEFILKKLMISKLKEKIKFNEFDEICPIIMQKVLDDGKKVNKICSDENIGFNSEDSLYKWIEPYYCISKNKNDTKCNMYIINYLKDIIYISEEELNKLFSEDSLGGIINYGLTTIQNNYNCGDRCDEENYLNKLQFWTGNVTSNASSIFIKTDTIMNWFPDEIPYPIEISYYQKKYNNSELFSEEDIDFIIKLASDIDNKYDLDNSNWFINKLNFEKDYSLYMNNKLNSSSFSLINFLIDAIIFKSNIYNKNMEINDDNQSLFVQYSSLKNLIQGNNIEDKKWIYYLSSGNYFDNYKPDFSRTTGLAIGIDLESKIQDNYDFDYYGINTLNTNLEKRKFNKINDLFTLNIKKEEYDFIKNKYINIFSPTFNFERLIFSEREFSDGFQYDQHLKVIYYYDTISSRPFRFLYSKHQTYKEKIECIRYDLDVANIWADINENFDKDNKRAMITQKVNKPYMITADFEILKKYNKNYKLIEDKIDNYICLDPISDMVIDSNINLIYAIYTRKYGYINNIINNEEIYPIFTYQRKFEIDVNSYEQQFPGVIEYYSNVNIFIIIGVIFVVIFAAIAVLSFYYLHKKEKRQRMKTSLNPLINGDINSYRDTETK